MLNYGPELTWLRGKNLLPRRKADALIARERRQVFSLQPEVRILAWAGVMLLVTAAGIWVNANIDRIGPIVIAAVLATVSLACYSWAAWRRGQNRHTLIDEFIVLLGALLLSVNFAWMETQFKLLEQGWPRHLLILAVLHGAAAYLFNSRSVLALALTALAGWLGVESRIDPTGFHAPEMAIRAWIASGAVLAWRALNQRFRKERTFEEVFEHYAANLALIGAVILCGSEGIFWFGGVTAVAIAAVVIRHGLRTRKESFVIYGYVYAAVAVGIVIGRWITNEAIGFLFVMAYVIGAIIGLFVLVARLRRNE